MAFEFRLPDIGEGVIEGEVIRWLVKEGDVIREDQPMVEVMTDKATVEIPAPRAGRVAKISAPEGKMCAVGAVMVAIDTEYASATPEQGGRPRPESERPTEKPAMPSLAEEERQFAHKLPTETDAPTATAAATVGHAFAGNEAGNGRAEDGGNGKVLATPATRKLARDMNIDIARVRGTGEGGRVTRDDVMQAAGRGGQVKPAREAGVASLPPPSSRGAQETQPARREAQVETPARVEEAKPAPVQIAAQAGDERIPFRGVRRKIADNMSRSKRTAAHFTYVDEADVTELVQLRERARKRVEERGAKLTFLPFIIKAVVAGLKKYPIINSTLDEEKGEIVLRRQYHIGVAAASEAGLIVPVVRDADKKSLFDIAKELGELSEKAKQGRASREELTGSTFTISSLGALGGVLATPIINYPEVAVLGVHKIKQAPVVQGGQIVIRDMTNFSISLDHRVVDGYEGALFLQHVISMLSDPTALFMEMV